MRILYGPDFKIIEDTVVTIGKFDGLHSGHKRIIKEVINNSIKHGLKSVVYTFLKNPKLVLHQDNFTPLMTNDEKSKAISELGIDYLIYEDFNESFSMMEPEEFVKNVLINKMKTKIVVMGQNSTFGKDRSGNVETMKILGEKYGFEVIVVDMVLKDGEVISSTGLRAVF